MSTNIHKYVFNITYDDLIQDPEEHWVPGVDSVSPGGGGGGSESPTGVGGGEGAGSKGPSINDVTQTFGVFGPPPPLSRIHATYQYYLSRFG